jgi:N6-adenosine-specific RNA methylase IME4
VILRIYRNDDSQMDNQRYRCIVADPPWKFQRQSERIRPRYGLMDLDWIKQLPISAIAAQNCHLYLWVPNALIGDGLCVMAAWGFEYKTVVTWAKFNLGVGNFFRNSSEQVLFGVKGVLPPLRKNARTWFLADRREHSRKPDEFYHLVETVSPGPRIDVFSREKRSGWDQWGNECDYFDVNKGGFDERNETVEARGSSGILGNLDNDALRLDERKTGAV